MNLTDLQRLISAGESETLEFKKSTADLSGACESLCAFLNSGREDTVVIGVSGSTLIGQDVTDRTQQEIANALKDIEPRIKNRLFDYPSQRREESNYTIIYI